MKGFISVTVTAMLLIGLVGLIGCGKEAPLEKRVLYYPNKKDMKEEWAFTRTPTGDTLEQGVHRQYFWNGSTSQAEIWKDGKREGSSQAWYETGALKWQKSYDAGKKQGTWRLFFKDGHPWITLTYLDDQLSGAVQLWMKEDVTQPKEAMFAKDNCVSGECALLELPVLKPDASPAEKLAQSRDQEIIKAFMK